MYTHNHNDTIIQLFPKGVASSGGCVKVYIWCCSLTLRGTVVLVFTKSIG